MLNITLWSLCLPALLPSNGGSDIAVSARIAAEELEVGVEYTFEVDLELAAGTSSANAGVPAPILQLDVPPSVELSGRVLNARQVAANNFLDQPYERLMTTTPTTVGFKLTAAPAPDETIGINVIAYLRSEDGAAFSRRRLELPLVPGAEAREVKANRSTWGANEDLLQIGDDAATFSLPRGDGTFVPLEDYLGKQKVIVLTYRAHW